MFNQKPDTLADSAKKIKDYLKQLGLDNVSVFISGRKNNQTQAAYSYDDKFSAIGSIEVVKNLILNAD